MRKLTAMALVASTLLLLAGPALAQPPPEEWGPRGQRGQLYNPRNVSTINGEVIKVEKVFRDRHGPGIHLTLASGHTIVQVLLGPDWFVSQQRPRITVDDQVSIVGSRTTFNGQPTFVAAEVRRGDKVLRLRDVRTGAPLWGRRR
jgi:hypothetical protein